MREKIKTEIAVLIILSLVVIFITGFWLGMKTNSSRIDKNNSSGEVAMCPQDVKRCPDGSWVIRVGSNCEFSACPKTDCVGEGQSLGPVVPIPAIKPKECCEGLTRVIPEVDGHAMVGTRGICVRINSKI